MRRKNQTVSQLKVRELMTTDVVTLTPALSIFEAIEKLLEYEISGAPVIDASRKPITLVSEADLMRLAAVVDMADPIGNHLAQLPKRDRLITVKPGDSFKELYRQFLVNPVRRVLVIDATGKLQGIVARRNIIRAFLVSELADRASPFV